MAIIVSRKQLIDVVLPSDRGEDATIFKVAKCTVSQREEMVRRLDRIKDSGESFMSFARWCIGTAVKDWENVRDDEGAPVSYTGPDDIIVNSTVSQIQELIVEIQVAWRITDRASADELYERKELRRESLADDLGK